VDAQIVIWDTAEGKPKCKLPNAHLAGAVTSLVFLDGTTLLSAGMDATIKTWTIA
jgi:WD40 repeat protein